MSLLHRFFVPPFSVSYRQILIPKEESRHIFSSFRYGIGDEVEFFDGRGNVYLCRLESQDRAVIIDVKKYKPLPYKFAVAQALLKGKKMEFVIKRLTEMAVSLIIPVCTERSIVKCKSINMNRWKKLAIESAKQSRNPFLPEIENCRSISEFVIQPEWSRFELKLFLDIPSAFTTLLKDVFRDCDGVSSLIAVVGPEGGFSDEEREILKDSGFLPVHIGSGIVMRSEIASFLLGGIVFYELS